MNYNLEMEKQIDNIEPGTKLLLQVCCAPCSSACIERLSDIFQINILYYNPNITDKNEYYKRLDEVKKYTDMINTKYPINIIDSKYDPESFFEISKGLEVEPERGKICYRCYKLKLEETAKVA
jgi:predicted adenine nucleotide alpha hydrolase (AANH) superfamily ATPase